MFPNYIIAFSDHSPGADMDIAAVALGLEVEKTITLDRYTKAVNTRILLKEKRFMLL